MKWQKFSLKVSCPVESSSWKMKQQNVNYEVSIIPVYRITHLLLGADGKAAVTCSYYTLLHYWKVQPGCYSFLQLCFFSCGWNKTRDTGKARRYSTNQQTSNSNLQYCSTSTLLLTFAFNIPLSPGMQKKKWTTNGTGWIKSWHYEQNRSCGQRETWAMLLPCDS